MFSEYNIGSKAIRKGDFSYNDVELPYIYAIHQEDWLGTVFTVASKAQVENLVPLEDFEKIDKCILLLLDGEQAKEEPDYLTNRRKENTAKPQSVFPLLFGASFVFIPLFYLLYDVTQEITTWLSLCLLCDAVLYSKGGDFLGVDWSVWGVAYFSSFFLLQLFYSEQIEQLTFWPIVSLLACVHIPYSVYYQWRVVKKSFPLCLTVQLVLLLGTIISFSFIKNEALVQWDWYTIGISVLLGGFFRVIGYFSISLLKQTKGARDYERKWKKQRYNSTVFQALLRGSDPITFPVDRLAAVVCNPHAKHEIIKVCNPYCRSCSKPHPERKQFLRHNPDIKLRIGFKADGEEWAIKTTPATHLLVIQQAHDTEAVHQTLDDQYQVEKKDDEAFAMKYLMNGELKQQQQKKINAIRNWCDSVKIRAASTININGEELPDTYRTHELKNILTIAKSEQYTRDLT